MVSSRRRSHRGGRWFLRALRRSRGSEAATPRPDPPSSRPASRSGASGSAAPARHNESDIPHQCQPVASSDRWQVPRLSAGGRSSALPGLRRTYAAATSWHRAKRRAPRTPSSRRFQRSSDYALIFSTRARIADSQAAVRCCRTCRMANRTRSGPPYSPPGSHPAGQ